MKPKIGILENHLLAVSAELNKLLADEVILYIKIRNYHWNIEGANFYQMHEFYEQQLKEISEIMDRIAERIRTIGHISQARLVDFLKLTNLIETPYTNFQNDQLKYLLATHETIICNLRRLIPFFSDKHNDIGTSDLPTQLLGRHEKMAWMTRAYIV